MVNFQIAIQNHVPIIFILSLVYFYLHCFFVGVDASPLMTWGTIEGTPLQIDIDVSATPGQVFKIPKESMRDGIGLKLANKALKSQREKKKAAMAQATSTILGERRFAWDYNINVFVSLQ